MAEKRMLHRNITKSDKLLRVTQTRGWRAFALYAAHLPYLDKAGRMKANPYGLKGTIWEAHPITAEDLAGDLDALADAGLLRIYRTPKGEIIMQYAKFDEAHSGFNKPHANEHESDFPEPDAPGCAPVRATDAVQDAAPAVPDNVVDNVPDNVPDNVVDKVPDKVPPSISLSISKSKSKRRANQEPLSAEPTRTNTQAFVDTWNDNRGRLPAVQTLNRKRKAAIRQLVKEHDGEALALFRDATCAVAADDYWVQRQYGFDNLVRAGRVLEKAEKFRAGGTGLGDARIKMLSRAERWAAALPREGSG